MSIVVTYLTLSQSVYYPPPLHSQWTIILAEQMICKLIGFKGGMSSQINASCHQQLFALLDWWITLFCWLLHKPATTIFYSFIAFFIYKREATITTASPTITHSSDRFSTNFCTFRDQNKVKNVVVACSTTSCFAPLTLVAKMSKCFLFVSCFCNS